MMAMHERQPLIIERTAVRRAGLGATALVAVLTLFPNGALAKREPRFNDFVSHGNPVEIDNVVYKAPNNWIGFRARPSTGVESRCRLGDASSTKESSSVWIAETGTKLLDIIQIGTIVKPDGQPEFFFARGRGVPFGENSFYEQKSLGKADTNFHNFRLELRNGQWRGYIDNILRFKVKDDFRNWPLRATQIQVESEGGQGDSLGGTVKKPTYCKTARIYNSATQNWELPTWNFGGYGQLALKELEEFGEDWFYVWYK